MDDQITPELLLAGYRAGIFPMGEPDGTIGFYSPDPRCIFELDRFHVPRSLRRVIQRGTFDVRVNTAFDTVIAACAQRPEGTWITDRIFTLYRQLHRAGYAHCVETWRGGRLAGGLYGVVLGGAFFGESMFHYVTNASKVALVALVRRMRERSFTLLDTQWRTPHLKMFGATEIPREEYLRRLATAVDLPREFV